ncbi:hypothetical protein FHQ18_00420 [Deferribacter autotrophicus]|uniref:Uncharacterized protein n=1 Tax=Deferribacter autotrophicus TaxID=500465 RepID=A0A5A8F6T3_9BACT|nr:hypothetical protein [Deferribacter autotrophicus]KAA0259375.1 hypothetical protein FHQ18_00420 [Deferribacter autotrophicus]
MTDGKLLKPKTIDSIRDVVIIEPLQKIVLNHKQYTFMKSKFVFLTKWGTNYTQSSNIVKNIWRPTLKVLGIRFRKFIK